MREQRDAPLRSDAQRNRERILEVALAELTLSADVPLSVIAREKAGVGQGTFYRHFPNRDALVLDSIAMRCSGLPTPRPTSSRRSRPTRR